jgi:hypothetical protein
MIEQNEKTFTVKIPILTKQTTVMEATTNYNENNAYFRLKKSRRTKRILWKLNFILLCNSVFDFINLKFSPQFHWFWFSAVGWDLVSDACFSWVFTSNWEERKIKEILKKIQLTQNGNNHGKYLSRRRTLFYR